MTVTVKCNSTATILLIAIFSLFFTSCQQSADNITDNISNKPPMANITSFSAPKSKPYPGLDTQISGLVSAYESGGDAAAIAYAKDQHISIINGMVAVEIHLRPEGKAAAVEAVNNAGAKAVLIYHEGNVIQAIVPLNQIKSLADPDIMLIGNLRGISTN